MVGKEHPRKDRKTWESPRETVLIEGKRRAVSHQLGNQGYFLPALHCVQWCVQVKGLS